MNKGTKRIKCKAMRGKMVPITWCSEAQYSAFCGSCVHSKNLDTSFYQKSKLEDDKKRVKKVT